MFLFNNWLNLLRNLSTTSSMSTLLIMLMSYWPGTDLMSEPAPRQSGRPSILCLGGQQGITYWTGTTMVADRKIYTLLTLIRGILMLNKKMSKTTKWASHLMCDWM